GRYAAPSDDLGIEPDVHIPQRIAALPARFLVLADEGSHPGVAAIEAEIAPPSAGDLRVILRQRDHHGRTMRSLSKETMAEFFRIEAWQNGTPLPIEINYDKVIWSGLGWAVGEIRRDHILADEPVRIRLSSAETDPELHLEGQVLDVDNQDRAHATHRNQ